ncbi:MAG: hypothetical protein K9N23_05560 [Akkermansiaceae bacterium]|nr:hypothetical protein [Akkermansiaceae bacterium]
MFRAIALSACLLLPLAAAPRPWKDPTGTRAIQGEFVSRDPKNVTIRRTDGRVFTLDLTKLHPDDRTWLDTNHPYSPTLPAKPAADQSAVFDDLRFGDTRQQVLAKLKASSIVELTADETFLGRLGLNGVFRTRKNLGGLPCLLYFDWSDEGSLTELSLQTRALADASYPTRIKGCWTELIQLLTTLYGNPLQNASYPDLTELNEGTFLASHLWRLEGGGSILLGTARESDGLCTVVRFSQQEINPVRKP